MSALVGSECEEIRVAVMFGNALCSLRNFRNTLPVLLPGAPQKGGQPAVAVDQLPAVVTAAVEKAYPKSTIASATTNIPIFLAIFSPFFRSWISAWAKGSASGTASPGRAAGF